MQLLTRMRSRVGLGQVEVRVGSRSGPSTWIAYDVEHFFFPLGKFGHTLHIFSRLDQPLGWALNARQIVGTCDGRF